MKNYFIVTGYGRIGSLWLCNLLNLHPQIFCSQGPDLEPSKNSCENFKTRNTRIHKQMDSFWKLNTDEYFDMLERIEPNLISYGNIHGIGAAEVFQNQMKRKYTIVNITRHPINRVESLKNAWLSRVTWNKYLIQNLRI